MPVTIPDPGTRGEARFDRIWWPAIVCHPRGKKKPRVKLVMPYGYMVINQEWVEGWRVTVGKSAP